MILEGALFPRANCFVLICFFFFLVGLSPSLSCLGLGPTLIIKDKRRQKIMTWTSMFPRD